MTAVAVAMLGGMPLVGCHGGHSAQATAAGTGGTSMSGTGGTSMSGTGTGGGTDTETGGQVQIQPAPGGARLLLAREYTHSVEMMLGSDAAAAAAPPDDTAQEGFAAVGAATLSIPPDNVEQLERSATAIADATTANPATLAKTVPCVTGSQDDACYTTVATDLGRLAFRRPLAADEVTRLHDIGAAGKAWGSGDFMTGLKYELMAILQSPSFLYVVEVGEMDPVSGYRKLTATELATRMSLFLTGHIPTGDLLDMADNGALDTEDQIRSVAQDMVKAPEARVAMSDFFDELLRLNFLATTSKDASLFPLFTPDLAEAMRQESLLLVHDIIWDQDTDYRTLFSADYTFINDPLAELYGITPPGNGDVFSKVTWPASQNRAGHTSQGSFLSLHSGPTRNSPTKRGKYVLERILCMTVPPPDPNASLNLPDPQPGETLKQILEEHMKSDACKNCHANFDPIGFAFEHFDTIGAWRKTDNGGTIETDGMVSGIGSWQNAKDLGAVLAQDPRTSRCLISSFVAGSLGHTPTTGEDPGIDALHDDFESSGFSVKSLLVEMVASPVFQLVDEPK